MAQENKSVKPRSFTPEELERFRKFEAEHEQKMATDPEHQERLEGIDRFLKKHTFGNDTIED